MRGRAAAVYATTAGYAVTMGNRKAFSSCVFDLIDSPTSTIYYLVDFREIVGGVSLGASYASSALFVTPTDLFVTPTRSPPAQHLFVITTWL